MLEAKNEKYPHQCWKEKVINLQDYFVNDMNEVVSEFHESMQEHSF